jgi:hypothetical protein
MYIVGLQRANVFSSFLFPPMARDIIVALKRAIISHTSIFPAATKNVIALIRATFS